MAVFGPLCLAESYELAFAFASRAGDSLIALDPVKYPETITTGICGGGNVVRVKHLAHQKGIGSGSCKEAASDTEAFIGPIFRITGGKASSDETCLLAGEHFLDSKELLKMVPFQDSECSNRFTEKVADVKKRKIRRCWRISQVGSSNEIILVEFEREGLNVLATLFWMSATRSVFYDYRGTCDESLTSCWRVDDNGTFDPKTFHFIFAFQEKDRYGLAIAWDGAEGQNLELLESNLETFSVVLESYRYWVPM